LLNDMPLQHVRDRVLLLRAIPTFRPLDDDSLTMIAEHSRQRLFRAGETVCAEGQPLSHCYLVRSGQVTSTRKGRRVAVVTRDYGVGVLSILARDTNGVHAVADQDSLTIELPARAFNDALDVSFPMLRNALRLTASGLVRKRSHLPAGPSYQLPERGAYPERPATVVEHLLAARSSPGLFSTANLDALLAIARTTTEMRLEPGHVLWSIGDSSSWWVRVGYGEIRCTTADGRFVDIGRKYMIGIMDAYGQEPRSFEARTTTRVVGYRTELEDALAALENHTDLARDLVASLATQALETPG
jgi:CRP-like cAMP-binding protein